MSNSHDEAAKHRAHLRALKVNRLDQMAQALAGLADEMVTLLTAHNELTWAKVFAKFAHDIRAAKTDKARKSAIEYINAIYGGMGSWNDFYLHGFGEPEANRSSLGYQIQSDGKTMLTEIESGIQEPPSGLIHWLTQFIQ